MKQLGKVKEIRSYKYVIKDDVTKASISDEHREFLDIIINEKYFKEVAAAYNFFVSYALSQNIEICDDEINKPRKSNIDDADRKKFIDIIDLIKGLYINSEQANKIPVRIMNALADFGIQKAMDDYWKEDSKELDMVRLLRR